MRNAVNHAHFTGGDFQEIWKVKMMLKNQSAQSTFNRKLWTSGRGDYVNTTLDPSFRGQFQVPGKCFNWKETVNIHVTQGKIAATDKFFHRTFQKFMRIPPLTGNHVQHRRNLAEVYLHKPIKWRNFQWWGKIKIGDSDGRSCWQHCLGKEKKQSA